MNRLNAIMDENLTVGFRQYKPFIHRLVMTRSTITFFAYITKTVRFVELLLMSTWCNWVNLVYEELIKGFTDI